MTRSGSSMREAWGRGVRRTTLLVRAVEIAEVMPPVEPGWSADSKASGARVRASSHTGLPLRTGSNSCEEAVSVHHLGNRPRQTAHRKSKSPGAEAPGPMPADSVPPQGDVVGVAQVVVVELLAGDR